MDINDDTRVEEVVSKLVLDILEVEKEGMQTTASYNDDGTMDVTCNYTVKISAPGATSGTVSVNDVLTSYSSDASIDQDSITIQYCSNDTYNNTHLISNLDNSGGAYLTVSKDGHTLSGALPKMDVRTYYLVSYSATLHNVPAGSADDYSYYLNNSVTVNTTNVNNSVSDSCTVSGDNPVSLVQKTGEYNEETGQIDWTITINEGHENWADILWGGLASGGSSTTSYYLFLNDILVAYDRDSGKEETLDIPGLSKYYLYVCYRDDEGNVLYYGTTNPNLLTGNTCFAEVRQNPDGSLNLFYPQFAVLSSNATTLADCSIEFTISIDVDDWIDYSDYLNTVSLTYMEFGTSYPLDSDTADVPAFDGIKSPGEPEQYEDDGYYYRLPWTISFEDWYSTTDADLNSPTVYWIGDEIADPCVVESTGDDGESEVITGGDLKSGGTTSWFPMRQWYPYQAVTSFMAAFTDDDSPVKDYVSSETVSGYTVSYDEDTGEYTVQYYSDVPLSSITAPNGVTDTSTYHGASGTYDGLDFYITGFKIHFDEDESGYMTVTSEIADFLNDLNIGIYTIGYTKYLTDVSYGDFENLLGVEWSSTDEDAPIRDDWWSADITLPSDADIDKEAGNVEDDTAPYTVTYTLTNLDADTDYTLTDTLDYSAYTSDIADIELADGMTLTMYDGSEVAEGEGTEVTLLPSGSSNIEDASPVAYYSTSVKNGKATLDISGTCSGTKTFVLTYSYKFTYTDTARSEGWSGELTNTATVTTLDDEGVSDSDTATVELGEDFVIKKSNDDYDADNDEVSYQVVINKDATQLNSGESLTVTDELDYSSYTDYISGISPAMDDSGDAKIYLYPYSDYDEETGEISGTPLTLTEYNENSTSTGPTWKFEDSGTKATLTIGGLDDSTAYILEYTYKLSFCTMDKVSLSLVNVAGTTLSTDDTPYTSSTTTTVTESPGMSKSYSAYDRDTQSIAYSVDLNTNAEQLTGEEDGTYDITDKLDYSDYTAYISGIDLLKDDNGDPVIHLYYLDENGNPATDEVDDFDYDFTDSGTVATLTITGIPDGVALVLEYSYQISFDTWNEVDALPLLNTVSVTTEGVTGSASSTYTAIGNEPEVWADSSAEKNAENYSSSTNTQWYDLDINEGGVLVNDGEPFTITDVLDYSSSKSYVEDISIQVDLFEVDEDGDKTFIKDETTDGWIETEDDSGSGKYTIKMTVEDGTHYYIHYGYTFSFADGFLSTGSGKVIANSVSVSIEGRDSDLWNDSASVTLVRLNSGEIMSTYASQLTLEKADAATVDSGDGATLLPGATYELDRYTYASDHEDDREDEEPEATLDNEAGWKKLGEFTTDESGMVELGEETYSGHMYMRYNFLYRLTEVEAPEGYELDDTAYYIYLVDTNGRYTYYPVDYDPYDGSAENLLTVSTTSDGTNIVTVTDNAIPTEETPENETPGGETPGDETTINNTGGDTTTDITGGTITDNDSSTTASNSRTGDTLPVVRYLVILLAAAAVIIFVTRRRRKMGSLR